MHGVARGTRVYTAEEIERRKANAEKWKENYSKVMEYKKNGEELIHEVWKLTETLVLMNPDCYSLWNYRRNIILSKLKLPIQPIHAPETPDDSQTKRCRQCNRRIQLNSSEYHSALIISAPHSLLCRICYIQRPKESELLQSELTLIQNSIMQSSKSYGIWFHRSWLLTLFSTTPRLVSSFPINWEHEVALCNQFLRYDSRNFHCWNYRRFIIKSGKISTDSELNFTETKIGEGGSFFGFNRSETAIKQNSLANYSAWHQRSALLTEKIKSCHDDQSKISEILENDFILLSNALLMHDGQSPWLYLRWLLGQLGEEKRKEKGKEVMEICEEILKVDREGMEIGEKGKGEVAETSKWALLTMVFLLRRMGEEEKVKGVLEELRQSDPDRRGFYDSLESGEAVLG